MSETPLDLAAIRARADQATAGPWRALTTGVCGGDHWYVCDEGQDVALIRASDGENEDQRQPDAEFIAAARSDVPALLAEVERLRAENAGLLSTPLAARRILDQMAADAEEQGLYERPADAASEARTGPVSANSAAQVAADPAQVRDALYAAWLKSTGPRAADRPWLARGDNHQADDAREGQS